VRLSASTVGLLMDCPRRWFLQNRAGASPLLGDGAWFGQLAHWLFETCAETSPPRPAIEATLRLRFAATPLDASWRRQFQFQALLDSLDRFEIWRDGRERQLLGTETRFHQLWDTDAGPVEVRGRVDRLETDVQGRLVVIDFKTSLHHGLQAYDDQLGIYAVAASRGAFGVPPLADAPVAPPELVWPAVAPRQTDIGCPVDQARPEATDEAAVLDRIAQAAAIVRSERFPATPATDICRHCGFRDGCPASVLEGVA